MGRRRTPHLAAALAFVVLLVAGVSGGAAAQEPSDSSGDTLSVRTIDGRDPDAVEIEFFYDGPRDAVPDLVVRESGAIVENTAPVRLDADTAFGIVLAIDASGSMEEGGAFQRAIDGARAFVENAGPDDQIGIVSFGDRVQVAQRLTSDEDALLDAIDGLGVGGGTAMYDGVREAVNLFRGSDLLPFVVVLTDGKDTESTTTLDSAVALLDDAGAQLFAIGLESEEFDLGAIEALAERTGGTVRVAGTPAEIEEVYVETQEVLRRQFRTTFVSEVDRSGPIALTLTIGTTTTDATYQVGARLDSALQVEPIPAPEPDGIAGLQSRTWLWVALALAVLAVGGTVFAVGATVVRERSALDTVLQPYADGFVAPDEDEDSLVTSAVLQRAVDLTGRFAERRGILTRVEDALERANLPLRAGEALFFYLVGVLLVFVLAALLTANVLGTVLFTAVAALLPPAIVSYLSGRRKRQFEMLLPDMLQLLASTLRAGYSLMQGVEAAAQEVSEPMRRELQRVVTESRLGMPLEQALDGVTQRMGSKDFDWAVMAIRIQREVGGNLAELLMTVSETMTERERLRRDINALTAEGRVSSVVLGLLPVGLGIAMYTINPDYIGGLFEDTLGTVLVIGAIVLMGFGFFWMSRIIKIEV